MLLSVHVDRPPSYNQNLFLPVHQPPHMCRGIAHQKDMNRRLDTNLLRNSSHNLVLFVLKQSRCRELEKILFLAEIAVLN